MTSNTLHAYARVFEALTPQTLSELDNIMTTDIRFADPFNDVKGIESVRTIFAHMYQTIPDARFKVLGTALKDGDPSTGYLHWRLEGRTKAKGEPLTITGMSQVTFNGGRVSAHIDFWDAATNIYERTPLLGACLKLMRKKFLQTRIPEPGARELNKVLGSKSKRACERPPDPRD